MPQNGINHPGVTALAQAFAINPLLRVINLNDNTFTEKGAVAMAKVRGARQGRSGPREPGLVVVFAVDPSAGSCSPPGPPTWCVSRGFSHVHVSQTGHLSPGGLGPGGSSVNETYNRKVAGETDSYVGRPVHSFIPGECANVGITFNSADTDPHK